MVAFGGPGSTPKQRMTQVAAGMGLLRSSVIDQHFDQRNRYGRLLMIVSQSPQLLGLGVDEDTSAVVEVKDDHEILRVVGRGGVTIFDPPTSSPTPTTPSGPRRCLASGVILHVLPHGSRFDLTTRSSIRHLRTRWTPPEERRDVRGRQATCASAPATSPRRMPRRAHCVAG